MQETVPAPSVSILSARDAVLALPLALILIVPLFELPRPSFVTGLPWKVELLASAAVLTISIIWRREVSSLLSSGLLWRRVFFLILVFAGWSAVSSIWAAFPYQTLHHTSLWALYASIFALTVAVCKNKAGEGSLFAGLAVTAGILGLICISDFITVVDFTASEGMLRIRWAKFAELLVTVSPLLWAASLSTEDSKKRILYLAAGVLGWSAAQLSLSKAALVAGVSGYVVLFILIIAIAKAKRQQGVLLAAAWVIFTVGFQAGFALFSNVPATTQYITGTADATRETSSMRLFTWKVTGQIIRDNPLIGVGADNFGLKFNDGRRRYAERYPNDPDNGIGEDYLFERAHNEYLQILAELGFVGFALFSAIFGYTGWVFTRLVIRNGRVSPVVCGTAAGMVAFVVSSLFTSFSFRAAQNGIAFFLLMGLLVRELEADGPETDEPGIERRSNRIVPMIAVLAALLLGGFSLAKGFAYVMQIMAERESDAAAAFSKMRTSSAIDRDAANATYALSYSAASLGDIAEAAKLMRSAIDKGIGVSVTYSRLATLQEQAADKLAAEKTLREGISIYPASVFLRTRLAILLEDQGRGDEAAKQLDIAKSISDKDTRGWNNLIRFRGLRAFLMAKEDPGVTEPGSLRPANAIYAYIDNDIPSATP